MATIVQADSNGTNGTNVSEMTVYSSNRQSIYIYIS